MTQIIQISKNEAKRKKKEKGWKLHIECTSAVLEGSLSLSL